MQSVSQESRSGVVYIICDIRMSAVEAWSRLVKGERLYMLSATGFEVQGEKKSRLRRGDEGQED